MNTNFIFADEPWLWAIPGLVILGALLWIISGWVAKRRLARFLYSMPHALPARWRRLVPFCVTMIVLLLLVLVLARPLTGPRPGTAERSGVDLVILLDVSKSMLVEDVAPNRLGAVTKELREWLKNSAQDRVSLVPFAGDAFVMSPLTFDYQSLDFVLEEVSPHSITAGGTNVPVAIETATELLDKDNSNARVILLISDGENLEGDALAAASKAFADRITILTVGVGTAQGGPVPADDYLRHPEIPVAKRRFIKDEYGIEVRSRADERTLRGIADATGGRFYSFTPGAGTFRTLQEQSLLPLARKSRAQHINIADYTEWFQIPLGCAILLMAGSAAMPLLRRHQPKSVVGVPIVQPEDLSRVHAVSR